MILLLYIVYHLPVKRCSLNASCKLYVRVRAARRRSVDEIMHTTLLF